MRVVPIRAGLIWDIEVVQEPVVRRDGALADERRPVCVACVALVDSVPVLSSAGALSMRMCLKMKERR